MLGSGVFGPENMILSAGMIQKRTKKENWGGVVACEKGARTAIGQNLFYLV